MTPTSSPLFSNAQCQLYYARFKPAAETTLTISGAYPVSLFFCIKGPRASLTTKQTILSNSFIAWNKGNFLCRNQNPVQLSWEKTRTVEFIEIRLTKEYLASLTGLPPKDWAGHFHLTDVQKNLQLATQPLALQAKSNHILNNIIHLILKPVAFQQLVLEARALELLAIFLTQLQQPVAAKVLPEAHYKLAALAKKHIDTNKGKKGFTITSLAELADTNTATLKQAFKAAYGKTIFRYFQEKNMQMAKKALQAGQPIADVSTQCGYTYIAHFSNAFKKEFGVPPSRFQ